MKSSVLLALLAVSSARHHLRPIGNMYFMDDEVSEVNPADEAQIDQF
jgi:hypothetical protein